MIPFMKNLWKIGYTRMMGITTITETVILTDVGVCLVARFNIASLLVIVLVLINWARELD
jgi:hypothetical protein